MQDLSYRSIGSYRWVICALLFFATTINYIDRGSLAVLEPQLRETIGWNGTQYGLINASFMIAYAFGSLAAGWMMDNVGVRFGFAISLAVWSIVAVSHALRNFLLMEFGNRPLSAARNRRSRGNFPASIKTVADWFPKKEPRLSRPEVCSNARLQRRAQSSLPQLCLYLRYSLVGRPRS